MEKGLDHIFNKETHVIIMGTFPSIQSRNVCYYNHPQNQFWKIIAEICNNEGIIKGSRKERYECLLKNGIGLWDVIAACKFEEKSSLDSKIIKNSIVYNDFSVLQKKCPNLKCIVFNSKNAQKLYHKYFKTEAPEEIKNWLNQITNYGNNVLPSTSPANARKKFKDKLEEWSNFLAEYINVPIKKKNLSHNL